MDLRPESEPGESDNASDGALRFRRAVVVDEQQVWSELAMIRF